MRFKWGTHPAKTWGLHRVVRLLFLPSRQDNASTRFEHHRLERRLKFRRTCRRSTSITSLIWRFAADSVWLLHYLGQLTQPMAYTGQRCARERLSSKCDIRARSELRYYRLGRFDPPGRQPGYLKSMLQIVLRYTSLPRLWHLLSVCDSLH